MSITGLTVSPTHAWDSTLDFATDTQLVKRAMDGDILAAHQVVRDGVDFTVQALQAGSAAVDNVVDLITTFGITFPAGFVREISIEAWVTGDTSATETGHLKLTGAFIGGATPTNVIDVNVAAGILTTNMAGAVGGFTTSDPVLAFGTTAANSIPVAITNEGAAESNSWLLFIKVGKLRPVRLGV